jgi:hypothetical protein
MMLHCITLHTFRNMINCERVLLIFDQTLSYLSLLLQVEISKSLIRSELVRSLIRSVGDRVGQISDL